MKDRKGTKGEWTQKEGVSKKLDWYTKTVITMPHGRIQVLNQNPDKAKANARLIADAGTTMNGCGKLPSELLEQRDELLEALQDIVKMQENNYGDGMKTHMDLSSLVIPAKQAINKVLKS